MAKGPCYYDFAGQVVSQGPLPATQGPARPQKVTRAEWIDAKGKQVGGAPKRCQKGKNCSATCIAQGEDCIVELPEPMQVQLRKMASFIIKKYNVQEDSLEDRRVGAALNKLAPTLVKTDNLPERSGRGQQSLEKAQVGLDRSRDKKALRQEISWKEVQELKKRRDLLGDAEFDQKAMALLQKDAFGRGLRLREKELEMIFDALPKSVQDTIASSGKATGKWWAGFDKDGNEVYTKNPTKARGLAVLDMWFRQGGTDAYSGRNGKVFPIQQFDVEHVSPLSKGGLDSPRNWVLARGGAQQKRNVTKLGEWIDSLPNSEAEQKAVVQKFRSKRAKSAVKKAVAATMDPKDYTNAEVAKWGDKKMGQIFGARTLFTSEFQPTSAVKGGGTGRPNSPPPGPFRGAIAMVFKEQGKAQAEQLTYALRQIWNEELVKGQQLTPQQAYSKMVAEADKYLNTEQKGIFDQASTAWANKAANKQFGFI